MFRACLLSVSLIVCIPLLVRAEPASEGKPLSHWISELSSADAGQRRQAVRAIAALGSQAAPATGALTQALKDSDWSVRGLAANALTKIGPAAAAALPQLKTGLTDANELVRSAMAGAVWGLSGSGNDALPVLLNLLRSQSPTTREFVVLTFDLLGPLAAPAVASTLSALQDTDPAVRAGAARALGSMRVDSASVRTSLRAAANDPDEGVRRAAQDSLASLGDPTTGGTPGTLPQASSDITAYLTPLRQHKEALTALRTRLQKMQNVPQPTTAAQANQWANDACGLGRDIQTAGQAFRKTLHDFTHARTRAGLIAELELARTCMDTFGALTDQYMILIKADHPAFQTSVRDAFIAEFRGYLIERLRRKALNKLEKYGVEDILIATSWAEARQATLDRLQTEIHTRIEQKTQEVFGLQFHNAATARAAVRQKVHQEVERQVARLLLKFTTNELVIEFVGGMIVRWLERDLWPRLREAFRNKDNLPERVARSKETMTAARGRLFALTPQADIRQVQDTLRGCEGTLSATRYLVGDLQRANQQALLTDLQTAMNDLKRLMDLTAQRFLLGKRDALEELGGEEEALAAMLRVQGRLIGLVQTSAVAGTGTTGTPGAVPRPPLVTFAGPMYLVHIIETSTLYGPQRKDTWILHPTRPDSAGTLLTADGSGGYFINKTDRALGPFTTNHQVGPALVANHISGVWYGQTFISGDSKYWQ